MSVSRPRTPSAMYDSVPAPNDPAHLSRGYGNSSHLNVDANDFASTPGNPSALDSSPLDQSLHTHDSQRRGRFEENFDAPTRGESVLMDGDLPQRSASRASRTSTLNQGATPSRSGTLKKKSSIKRSGSRLRRSSSRRSTHAGSIRGVSMDDEERGSSRQNSVFYTPVPTSGSPTEILANRFQAWRKLLKDLITYFREVGASYEHRAKGLLKVSNVINNTNAPSAFLLEGGLNDANRILRDFHKQSVAEANKAKEIENEVVNQLSGLRADLAQKIKEIKSLSGDFKNSVEKEKEVTRKCVNALDEALSLVDTDPAAIAGKGDPYVVKLGVDRQVEKQIDEENYLHRAYLNLENSGRELESIVVGEIQKAYNALASILKRDADEAYSTIERLRSGPVGMPRDFEWNQFVTKDPHFVNPNIPLRRLEDIEYPGRHHPATTEVRYGMLERKSKYLKSYTPGWYVLSPTHLHEFKSADRIYTQPPVMSLYLPDQKLGSHSQPGSSSNKFVLKGRQTGSMHRGHTWVFRAETYDTMLAWYEDVKKLTEVSGEERNAFVRRHTRSVSQSSARSAISSDALEEDEADEVPYSANQSTANEAVRDDPPQRPSPGGRFPSDIQLDRNLQQPLSSNSSEVGNDLTTASGGLQESQPYSVDPNTYEAVPSQAQYPTDQSQVTSSNAYAYGYPNEQAPPTQQYVQNPYHQDQQYFAQNPGQAPIGNYSTASDPQYAAPYAAAPMPAPAPAAPMQDTLQQPVSQQPAYHSNPVPGERPNSSYGEWMAPAAGGAAVGALGAAAYNHYQQDGAGQQSEPQLEPLNANDQMNGSTNAKAIPTPIPSNVPVASEPDSLATTPATSVHRSFLEDAEVVPVAASPKIANGGVAQEPHSFPNPKIARNNTDVSVSDLHVPGEFPKGQR